MEELSLDNILDDGQMVDFLGDTEETQSAETTDSDKENKETKESETTEVNPNELFGEPESVGSDEDIQGKEGTPHESSTSPNFYSSIANALVEDGVFQNLDDKDLAGIKSAEDFSEFIKEQVQSQFNERQKRIDEALSYGIEPSEVQKYERYLETLDSISEDSISKEDEQGENLRKNLIYQDYINRGFSKERALKYVERSFKAGTDIDDAKDALQSNREHFKEEYNKLIKEAKEEESKAIEENKKKAEQLRTSILEEDKAFGEIDLDKNTRQKVYDTICKPVWTDPKTGEKLTALQKYESENRIEFMKNLGLVFTLTDGFKKLDGLVGGKVKKELKKGIRELENTINNTQRTSDGNLSFANGLKDPESRYSRFTLDI